jgi:hypothetical protein
MVHGKTTEETNGIIEEMTKEKGLWTWVPPLTRQK